MLPMHIVLVVQHTTQTPFAPREREDIIIRQLAENLDTSDENK